MQEQTKDYLPSEWWSIAEVVDAFESECTNQFPSLRPYAQRIDASHQLAALAELVKVDFERRWRAGRPRRIEQYLDEYPELKDSSVSLEELIRHECVVRIRCGDQPSLGELSRRFPQWSVERLVRIQESAADSLSDGSFGYVPPPVAKGSGDGPGSPSHEAPPAGADETPNVGSGFDPWSTMGLPRESPKMAGQRDTRRRGRSGTHVANGSSAKPATSAPAPAPTKTGTIGRYKITQELGSGGFGVVYRCYDEDLKKDVAIKVPHKKYATSGQQRQAFLHEAQTAARLKHPGIVDVLYCDQTEDGRVYIVYEYIEGMTLHKRLKQGRFTHEQAADWVAKVADALHYAHLKQIVHRDIKPTNILLDQEDRPHVADFGLAKKDDQYFRDDTDAVVGSLAYLSPEQAAAKSQWATPQSDIYTLGVVLYELLCRKRPFCTTDMKKALAEIQGRAPFPPRTIDDKIPKALEDVCLKAMNKDPADRYTTAADMAADLRAAVAPKTAVAWMYAAAAGTAAAAILAAVVFHEWTPDPTHSSTYHGPSQSAATSPEASGTPSVSSSVRPPELVVYVQRSDEEGITEELQDELYYLDKVKLAVNLGQVQRYVYLWWYDADGIPRGTDGNPYQRLWPPEESDLNQQVKQRKVFWPNKNNSWEWRHVDDDTGQEMVLVGTTDHPLTEDDLSEFLQKRPFRRGDFQVRHVRHVSSDDVQEKERGILGSAHARPWPWTDEFLAEMEKRFLAFHAAIIPHR